MMQEETLVYMGVDPGLKGGLSVFEVTFKDTYFYSFTLIDSINMPVCPSNRYKTKKSNRIDVEALTEIVQKHSVSRCCIELVSAMPAKNKAGKTVQGSASTFTFGYGTGQMESVMFVQGLEIIWVTPSVWKKHFHLIKKPKIDSVHKAAAFWPEFEFTKLAHDGRAEAALIGTYGITKQFMRG